MNAPVRSVVVHLALACAALVGVIAIGWVLADSLVMPRIARSGWPVVLVPDLSGLSQADATKKLTDMGLDPVVDAERRKADRVGPDMVALQLPIPGDSVKKGHVVRMWLSAGHTTVPVPDLSGQDSAEAAIHVQEAGLQISDLDWMTSGKVPAGKVIRTDPMFGTLLNRGGTVRLILSSGTDPDSDSARQDTAKSASPASGPRTF